MAVLLEPGATVSDWRSAAERTATNKKIPRSARDFFCGGGNQPRYATMLPLTLTLLPTVRPAVSVMLMTRVLPSSMRMLTS